MQKIGDVTPTADINGEWTNGNVAAGTAPTILDAGWLNSVQRELISILSAAAIAPDPLNDGQVITSLKKLFLQVSNNLSEIKTAGTAAQTAARTNLGLGNSATLNTGTAAGTVATGNDSRITGAMQKSNNLSDLVSYSTARSNMGLKGAALLDVGAGAGTVAAGDDTRITGAMQKTNNLSDLQNYATARSNLGLGTAASATLGTGANQVPDMNSFTRGSGYFKLPNGIIVQYMQGTTNTSSAQQVLYPITFPSTVFCVVASAIDVSAPNYMATNLYTTAACLISAYTNSGTVRAATGAYIIAIGI